MSLHRHRLSLRVGAAMLALVSAGVLLPACSLDDDPSREEVRAFLDDRFRADPNRDNTWLADGSPDEVADEIDERIDPRDRFSEEGSVFMRDGDYIVAVFPEGSGSRIEFDDYDRIRNRYPLIIGAFWGLTPTSYGPRGNRGGGVRGGGPGAGK